MAARLRTFESSLDEAGIDLFSEWLDNLEYEMGIERESCVRVRLLMEEVLLRLMEHFDEAVPFVARCDARLGRPRLRIEVKAAPFNPLDSSKYELEKWSSSLRTAIGITPQYSYVGGSNILRLAFPYVGMNAVLRIALAILTGTILGFLGMAFLPENWRQAITDVFLAPTSDVWTRMLNAISGPIIFCTVVTAMLNTNTIDERGGSSVRAITRFFAISLLIVTVAMICVFPLFGMEVAYPSVNRELLRNYFDALLKVVPSNVFEPFVESNTVQLLFISFVLGSVLVKLGSVVDGLKSLVRETNVVGLQLALWVSWLVPLFTSAFLCLEIWRGQVGVLLGLWRPMVAALIISLAIMVLLILFVAVRVRFRPSVLFRKLLSPFLLTVKTGSLDKAFEEARHSCTRMLGINAEYVKVGLPQGLVLYMPISAVGTIVFTIFVAGEFDVDTDTIWYTSAIIMAVVVFVATPPVPGANLLAYVVLFSTLGIPRDALLDAMVFDIIFGIFAAAANQTMLQLEMLYQANRLGLVDRDLLTNS